TASWSESLNKNATGSEMNLSESYWTYWHWFEQIANGDVGDTISTGGDYYTAAEIITRYGIMNEGDFISNGKNAELSLVQQNAEQAVHPALASGDIKDESARQDRAKVRQVLNQAFGLSADVVAQMNRVFGAATSRTLDRTATTTGTKILMAKGIPIKVW